MRRLAAVFALVAASLFWAPAAASAKGTTGAVLRGPDVAGKGVATLDQYTAQDLAAATNLYSMFATERPTSRLVERDAPKARGPRYDVKFRFGDHRPRIRQVLYPFADGGPIAYTPPGQSLCDRCTRTSGGWFDVRYVALDVLGAYRVPIPSSMHPADWPTARDGARGLSISYPPSWHAAPSTLTPVLADPVVPLAVGTAAMVPQKLGECDIVPQHAVEAVGPTDALVLIYLYQGMASWSSTMTRPTSFGPELPWRVGNVQCTEGNTDATVRTLNFSDGKAHLSVMVVVGKDASPQRTAEVYAVLDSLRVE